jgi:hypothetical protein
MLLAAERLENLALKAKVTADSQYNINFLSVFVADGKIPVAGGREGSRQEWAVKGETHRQGAEVTFEWAAPVDVAEVVYYGRTSYATECWKDYEIYLADSKGAVAKGSLKSGHGPQRMPLGAVSKVQKIRVKFLSSYGGANPGAAEMAVYSAKPAASQLGSFIPLPPYIFSQPEPLRPLSEESAALMEEICAGKLGFKKLLLVQRHPYNVSHVYTYHAESFVPGGGIYQLTPGEAGGGLKQIWSAGTGEVMDLDLSYDGTEILFSWKETDVTDAEQVSRNYLKGPEPSADTKYQVYRMKIDGSEKMDPVQLTQGANNNFNPCWLPDGGIAFLSDRKQSFAYCFVTTSPLLYRMERDGSRVRKLSHGYLNDFTPSVLNNGRVIYSRWEYVDRPACPIQSLWTINPDGTGVAGFFGNRVIEPGTFMEARSIGDTRKVLCVMTAHNGSCRGALGILDTDFGANAQEAIRNITPEIRIPKVNEGTGNALVNVGPYENPYPVDNRYFVVSKMGTILLRDYDGTKQVTLQKPLEGMGFFSPRPVYARKTPPVIPSSLPTNAAPWGTVLMQDVYNGLEPYVKRGEIKQIAVVEEIEKSEWSPIVNEVPLCKQYAANTAFGFQFPLVSCGATYAPKKIWGYAKVEDDGSAYFKVPAGVPIYFLPLDAEGRAVQRMRTFTHFQPGEMQSCIGCHADRNYTTPYTRGARPATALRSPQELDVPEWGRRKFDYAAIVQPVLDKNCVSCHNAKSHPNGVDLSGDKTDFFNVSYDILARKGTIGEWEPQRHGVRSFGGGVPEGASPYTKWIPSINGTEYTISMITPKMWGSPASKLADLVLSGHPDNDGKPRLKVSASERRRLMAWMDVNVPYYRDSKSDYPNTMGCRRIIPVELGDVLKEVASRRCVSCHKDGKIPRSFYTRITNVEDNNFLLAPLARTAGGLETCGKAVFESKNDPDYQKILGLFDATTKMLKEKPRMDMSEAIDD